MAKKAKKGDLPTCPYARLCSEVAKYQKIRTSSKDELRFGDLVEVTGDEYWPRTYALGPDCAHIEIGTEIPARITRLVENPVAFYHGNPACRRFSVAMDVVAHQQILREVAGGRPVKTELPISYSGDRYTITTVTQPIELNAQTDARDLC